MLGRGQMLMGGGGGSVAALAVADVFSTTLYTGTGSALAITTGTNLTGAGNGTLMQGGLVWIKSRNNIDHNLLFDTVRGAPNVLYPALPNAQSSGILNSFTSTGFTTSVSSNGATSAAWTFRRAKKYFDIVTYTGNGTYPRTMPHGLNGAVGMILLKGTSASTVWPVYHRSLGTGQYALLDGTGAATTSSGAWGTVTDTAFTLASALGANANGVQYIAYLFAHDDAADGVIQCGSYPGNGSASGPTVTLGWQPQFVLVKAASVTGNWTLLDTTRGIAAAGAADAVLLANTTAAETSSDRLSVSGTGFQITSTNADVNTNAATYIYMAIRKP